MKKVIRLTESDLVNLVKRVINEQQSSNEFMLGGGRIPKEEVSSLVSLRKNLIGKTVQLYNDYEQTKKGSFVKITDLHYVGEINELNKTNTHIIRLLVDNLIDGEPRVGIIDYDCNKPLKTFEKSGIYWWNKQLNDYIDKNYCKLLPPDNPQTYQGKPDFSSTQSSTNPPQSFA